ncbi:hypothetical protein TELCIR_07574 [Teladorsagia circumcincta]|uniref:Collagen triple helix repeat protein n=1 Tax=Teladorsagia circumcincta TaxID=45464 RepID=A0A2G9ULG2_TELCI|nr:hypothetical protein TELCIR_07574 [Teladorsagia circumcincta]
MEQQSNFVLRPVLHGLGNAIAVRLPFPPKSPIVTLRATLGGAAGADGGEGPPGPPGNIGKDAEYCKCPDRDSDHTSATHNIRNSGYTRRKHRKH